MNSSRHLSVEIIMFVAFSTFSSLSAYSDKHLSLTEIEGTSTHLALRNLTRTTLTRASPTGFEGSMGTPQRVMGASLLSIPGNEVSNIYGSLV